MIIRIALLMLCSVTLVQAQTPAKPQAAEKPKVYALVAAMGSKLTLVREEQSTGSNLSPFKREAINVPNNQLNALTLQGLDKAIAKTDATSERVYIAMSPPGVRAEALSGQALADWVIDELRKLPERDKWDRIVLAIPGFRGLAREGMPSRMSGMGVFAQPLCQGDPESCEFGWTSLRGADAVTPEGEEVKANYFVAPYSAVEVWMIDPKTLQVIDRGESIKHTKMFDPKSDSLNLMRMIDPKVMAERIVTLVQGSVAAAVADAEGRGTVDVRMRKEVKPDEK